MLHKSNQEYVCVITYLIFLSNDVYCIQTFNLLKQAPNLQIELHIELKVLLESVLFIIYVDLRNTFFLLIP